MNYLGHITHPSNISVQTLVRSLNASRKEQPVSSSGLAPAKYPDGSVVKTPAHDRPSDQATNATALRDSSSGADSSEGYFVDIASQAPQGSQPPAAQRELHDTAVTSSLDIQARRSAAGSSTPSLRAYSSSCTPSSAERTPSSNSQSPINQGLLCIVCDKTSFRDEPALR